VRVGWTFLEQAAEPFAGAGQVGLDGRSGAAEQLADLGRAALVDVVEDDHRELAVGEGAHGLPEGGLLCSAGTAVVYRCRCARDDLAIRASLDELAAPGRGAAVDRHPPHPQVRPVEVSDLGPASMGGDEGLLSDLLAEMSILSISPG
jgi:hypothetical protein